MIFYIAEDVENRFDTLNYKLGWPLLKEKTKSLKKNHKEFIRNNNSILKTQQRFKSERHNVFTKEINMIKSSSNDDKKMQSINLIESYPYGTS